MPLLDISAIRLSMRYGSYDGDQPLDLSTLLPTLVADSRTVDTLNEVDWVRLNGNNVTDLTPLLQLASLARLDLSDTKVSDLSPLGQLFALKDLDLSYSEVLDWSSLTSLVGLEDLGLGGTTITDIHPLENLTVLRRLYLSGDLDVAAEESRIFDFFLSQDWALYRNST